MEFSRRYRNALRALATLGVLEHQKAAEEEVPMDITVDPLVDRAAKLAHDLYGARAMVRSKMVQHPDENPRLQWWVDSGRGPAHAAIAADSLDLLVKTMEARLTARESRGTLRPQERKMEATEHTTGPLLTSKQAAAYLGVSSGSTISKFVLSEGLKVAEMVRGHSRTGKQYRFSRADLDEFLKSKGGKIRSFKMRPSALREMKARREAKAAANGVPARHHDSKSTHDRVAGGFQSRLNRLTRAYNEKLRTMSAVSVTLTEKQVYHAAIERGLSELEKEI